jgi:thioredoxin reductase (NADPH)
MEKVIIIGAGPAGYTAAVYAARAHLQPLVIEGPQPGGQLTTTTEVENWPGEEKGILGPELMSKMKAQADHFGARFSSETVTVVDFSSQPLKLTTDAGQTYEAQTVIIATGASARRLGLESEKALFGKGVSACATCDGFFFRGKTVAVVGGGDAAMEEACHLTKFATQVTILNRTDKFRASPAMLDRAQANPKIVIKDNVEVAEVLGVAAGHVTGLKLKDVQTGAMTDFPVDGVFTAIGHVPNTGAFKGILDLDDLGYIICPPGTVTTKVPGVFAAGDVMDRRYRQAVTAAASGCMAALEAERFLTHRSFGETGKA